MAYQQWFCKTILELWGIVAGGLWAPENTVEDFSSPDQSPVRPALSLSLRVWLGKPKELWPSSFPTGCNLLPFEVITMTCNLCALLAPECFFLLIFKPSLYWTTSEIYNSILSFRTSFSELPWVVFHVFSFRRMVESVCTFFDKSHQKFDCDFTGHVDWFVESNHLQRPSFSNQRHEHFLHLFGFSFVSFRKILSCFHLDLRYVLFTLRYFVVLWLLWMRSFFMTFCDRYCGIQASCCFHVLTLYVSSWLWIVSLPQIS